MSLKIANGYHGRSNQKIAAMLAFLIMSADIRKSAYVVRFASRLESARYEKLILPIEKNTGCGNKHGERGIVPNVHECLIHAQWLIDHGRGTEPCVLYLPKIEAQKRKANKEKRRRVTFECDEQTYSDFHAERSRYIDACGGHVPIAHAIMVRLLQQLPDESIKRLAEDDYRDEG